MLKVNGRTTQAPFRKRFAAALRYLGILSLLLCLTAQPGWAKDGAAAGGHELRVQRITPAGVEVPPGRQLVIQFDRPVVPLGRMARSAAEIPVTIEPGLNCQWRWLDPATLSCILGEGDGLQPATEYRMVVNPGIAAADGATLAKPVAHSFFTVRPRVTEAWFKTWLNPRLPQHSLRGNLPMDQASLAAHLFYQLPGSQRLAAKVEEDPDYPQSPRDKDNRIWRVSPGAELPAGLPAELRVEPGIMATKGRAPGVEQRVIDTVFALPEFRFLGLRCTGKTDKAFEISPEPTPSAQERCLPSGGVTLLFSSPVVPEDIKAGLHFTPPLAAAAADGDPWEQVYSYSQRAEPYSKDKRYAVDLPEAILRPYQAYRLEVEADAIKDEFGRPLAASAAVSFATDHRLPDYALLNKMVVLEKGLDTDGYVWAVNLDELRLNYEAVKADGSKTPGGSTIKPDGPGDSAIPVPLGIRQLLDQGSGVVQGQFTTQPALPERSSGQSWFFAQVTPFHVHLKLGHHNSMAWITDLQTGRPVPGVTVQIIRGTFKDFGSTAAPLATAATGPDGVADLPGTTTLDPALQHIWANDNDQPLFFLTCHKGENMAVLPVRYDFQVAAEGANREFIPDWLRPLHGHIHAWGATAQGIYKAGDTVQYKIFVRDQNNLRLTRPPGVADTIPDSAMSGAEKSATARQSALPATSPGQPAAPGPPRYRLKVLDPMDKVIHEQNDIVLSPFGAFDGEVSLAKSGAVGWHRFVVAANFTTEEWEAMRVLVSDFTPAPFKVTADLNGKTYSPGEAVTVTTSAKLHAGGAYSGAAARVTATLKPQPFAPDNPQFRGFQFDSAAKIEGRKTETATLHEFQGNLDENGQLLDTFTLVDTPVWFGQLTVESSVQDDRGKSIASRTSAPCYGRDRYVGILQTDWTVSKNKTAKVRVVVVDRDGANVAGVPIRIRTEHRKTWGARVKGAGDSYLTEYEHTWEPEQEMTGVSAAEPLEFEFTPREAGTLRLAATIADTAGRDHTTTIDRWVTGPGAVLWESTPGNLLNVSAEKSSYNVGETARFLVQNPFPGGQALITVERYGVISRWTKTFADSSEIVEIPVLPDYLPGFYVSVMVTAPRVEKPLGPQGEDLGKPTFRMGYVKVPVKDFYKELVVDVHPDKEVYKPRDTVQIDLQVRPRNLGAGETSPPVELAIAVLDEAVLDLLPEGRKGFDPYQGFYALDELDLSNYNLLMQLAGRDNLALKGANPGGDGGPDLSLRSLFKFVSYWHPALRPNAEGKASISFEVPDNLTGWRVLAMAVSPEDRMGLGEGRFQVNQATEIRPALVNQLVEGDRFSAAFTLMNRTDRLRTLAVNFTARGPVSGGPLTKSLTLLPFQRETLRFPVQTTGAGTLHLALTAGDESDRDGLTHTLQVKRPRPQEAAARYGMTDAASATEDIQFPENMREDTGELTLILSPTVLGGATGAFSFIREYPYSCWEQRLARGVMAALYTPLAPYIQTNFLWPDSNRVVEQTLALAVEHQAPNGGMTYYTAKDEYVSPYVSAFTGLAFNWLRELGYRPPDRVEGRLQDYLQNLLRHDAVPPEFSKEMTATVRALTLAVLAERGKATLADVLRFRAHLPAMNLFGKAFYLRALLATGGSSDQQRQVLDGILAHADQSAGQIVFTESEDSGFKALLGSPGRDNAAILSGLLAWLQARPDDSGTRELATGLMRSLTLSRKGRDHWPSTQENLFVVKALSEYAKLFEAQQPDMTVEGRLDQKSLGTGQFNAYTDPPLVFIRPPKAGDAGRRAQLQLEKKGAGRLYYGASLAYSPAYLNLDPVNAGIEVHREYSVKRSDKWLLLPSDMVLRTGEVVRVDLYVSSPAERYFVVLEDPVPGGLEPVNRELATAAAADADTGPAEYPAGSYRLSSADWQEESSGRWGFYHRELRHEAVRFYSERLAAGRYHLSYTAQAIAPGRFQVLPVHAEEMYAQEVYGHGIPAVVTIDTPE